MIEQADTGPVNQCPVTEANGFPYKAELVLPLLVAVSCAIGAVVALATACDVAVFVLGARPATKLADPPRISKLILVFLIFLSLGLFLGTAAWRTWQRASVQRMIASTWSMSFTLLWSLLVLYVVLLYYPLPYHSHHIDKLLLASVVILLWSVTFILRPSILTALLNGRIYGWTKMAVINVLVFVLVGEVALRLMDPVLARSGLFGNKHSSADLKPYVPTLGSIRMTNSQGFRDRERMFERTTQAPRMVALGDSFTYGAGVTYDEIFTTLLERSLQELASGVEIINLGVSGWDPSEYFHLLKVYGSKFEPDLVMMNFFIGNDIMRRRGAYVEEPIVVAGQSYYVHTIGNWVHDTFGPDRWYLFHNINYLLKVGAVRLRQTQDLNEGMREAAGVWVPFRSREGYLKDIDERSEIYLKEDTPAFGYHWNRTVATLNEMREFLGARGIPLMLVLLPAQEQLDPDLRRELMTALGTGPDHYDFTKPQRLLTAWCEQHGVLVVDLLPAFEQVLDRTGLYFQNDIHWTKTGHDLAARTILPILQRQIATRHLARDDQDRR